MIKTIEIICKPCHRCEVLAERIKIIMQCVQFKYRYRIKYKFKHTKDIRAAERYGYSLRELPIVLINGNVAFVGYIKGEYVLRMRLEAIMKEY